MNNSISWTSEQLKKQVERTKSDMEFINEGAVYTFDEGAQEPRLDISSDKSVIVHAEMITIGEMVELGASFWDHVHRKIKSVYAGERNTWYFLPANEYTANALPEFIKKFGIITLYGRCFFARRHCDECSRSYLHEISESDKQILKKICGEESWKERGQIREVAERSIQVEFIGKEFLERLVNKVAEKILAHIAREEEKLARRKQEDLERREQERIKKEQQEEEDKLRKEREELEQLGPLV